MQRTRQYTLAALVATVVTVAVAVIRSGPPLTGGTGPYTLVAVFDLYAATTVVLLTRADALLTGDVGNVASGVFTGGLTLGGTTLAGGLGSDGYAAAVAVGVGLCLFGAVTGYWMATEQPDRGVE